SYVTGHGVDAAKQIYSHIYSSDGVAPIPPGILAEGPNQYQGWRYSRFFGKCYADTNTDWTVSEHAIYFNANLVFVLAMADATAVIPAF
ncbi:MAG: glycoside hydrolase, partial [Planctomycetota bacterium]